MKAPAETKCAAPGCLNLGTGEPVIVLCSADGALVQKFAVASQIRCAGHRPDAPSAFLTRAEWAALAGRFALASKRSHGHEVFAERAKTRVFYVEKGADVAKIPVYVEVAGGEERAGDARVHSDRLTRGTGIA